MKQKIKEIIESGYDADTKTLQLIILFNERVIEKAKQCNRDANDAGFKSVATLIID